MASFRTVSATGIVLLAVVLAVSGCSSQARDRMLGALAHYDQYLVEFSGALGVTDPAPGSIDDLRSEPADRLFIWSGAGQPDDEVADGPAAMVVYGFAREGTGLTLDARLLGYGFAGGGWNAESVHGYLCVQYSVSPDSVADHRQVDCPEAVLPRSTQAELVSLDAVIAVEDRWD